MAIRAAGCFSAEMISFLVTYISRLATQGPGFRYIGWGFRAAPAAKRESRPRMTSSPTPTGSSLTFPLDLYLFFSFLRERPCEAYVSAVHGCRIDSAFYKLFFSFLL